MADQKLPIPVPRVRDRGANREIPLTTYERRQVPRAADAGLFRKVLVGLTCRQYEACAEAVGLSASSVSRRFIRASARHLQTLCERRLDRDEFVALVLDGKTFAEDAMVIALGITLQGQKQILGFVQMATENGPMIWRELDNFSCGSVCMVLASNTYEETDYFRDDDEFLSCLGSGSNDN